MKIVALMPWYDEAPSWLAGAVSGLAKVGVDHLVAIDGCYALFPNAVNQPRSYVDQAATIMDATEGLGIGCTIVRPRGPFVGNEVEKRNLLFDYGRLVADEGDWFYCFDSDERVLTAPENVRELLDRTIWNAGEISVVTPVEPYGNEQQAAAAANTGMPHDRASGYRCFFRNLPGLSVEMAHYIVGYDGVEGERRYLRGRSDLHEMEPAIDLVGFLIEHRTNFRERGRSKAAQAYYRVRDAAKVEQINPVMVEHVDGGLVRMP